MAWIYVDIDGTLTDRPNARNGSPHQGMLQKVRDAIAAGHNVVVWSGGGYRYAKRFCRKYGLRPKAVLRKPTMIVDDSPRGLLRGHPYTTPDEFLAADV